MKKLLYFSLLLYFISCGDKSTVVSKYETGETKEKYSITNDSLITGEYLRFFVSGDIAEQSYYSSGNLDSTRTLFYENGKIEIVENYKNGIINGPYTAYYDSGVKKVNCNYENGVLTGLFYKYYPSGELQEKVTMVNNEENGPFEEYHKNGNLKWKGTFRNGDNEFGLLEEYDSSGTLIKKMMCDSLRICKTIWRKEVDSSL